MPTSRYAGPRVLSQALAGHPDAKDRAIMAMARKRAKTYPKTFSKYVKGIRCALCDSRDTITEFYRHPPDRARFGVTACDNCGAC